MVLSLKCVKHYKALFSLDTVVVPVVHSVRDPGPIIPSWGVRTLIIDVAEISGQCLETACEGVKPALVLLAAVQPEHARKPGPAA